MLTWWRKSDDALVSVSGVNSDGDPAPDWDFEHNVQPNCGGLIGDYDVLTVDDATAYSVFTAGSVALVRDANGNPSGVTIYPRLTMAATPVPASVGAPVSVVATLPAGSPDTSVTFQHQDGATVTEQVVNGQATHSMTFASTGLFGVVAFSLHHGSQSLWIPVQ